MKIASFDIFDTLLLLSCGNEEQMFRILGYNILGNDVNLMDLCEFIRIRKMGEQTAHMQTTTEEITTEDIYKQCDFSALTAVPNSDIMETEFSLMAQLLIPIWKNIACLKKYRQPNRRASSLCFPKARLKFNITFPSTSSTFCSPR